MGKDFSAVTFYNDAAFAYTDQRNDTPNIIWTQEEHEQSTERTGLWRETPFS